MAHVGIAAQREWQSFMDLAREVEPLFGPMVCEPGFIKALQQAFDVGTVFCVHAEERASAIRGACVIDLQANEIAWLAVSANFRGKGLGSLLLEYAMDQLDQQRPIRVTTFAEVTDESHAAKKLYARHGFVEVGAGELNPAGLATVIMEYGV